MSHFLSISTRKRVGFPLQYIWHIAFTGKAVLPPDQHLCMCEVYGICVDKSSDVHKGIIATAG